MIEITDGFTSVCAGSDPVSPVAGEHRPTGARVTVDFCRETALADGQAVRAHYEFGGGQLRTATGIATATRVAMPWGRPAVFHYRLSHWIDPAALMRFAAGKVPERMAPAERPMQQPGESPDAAPAGDRFPA